MAADPATLRDTDQYEPASVETAAVFYELVTGRPVFGTGPSGTWGQQKSTDDALLSAPLSGTLLPSCCALSDTLGKVLTPKP